MSAPAVSSSATVKFHVSLHSASLERSVDFFRVMFASEPAKLREDYAKFDLDEPPLVLSLIASPHSAGGALDHLGIRLADPAAVVELQARLESAGWQTQREEQVECCYSRQTKFWVTDPDGVLWEFYILHEDPEDEPPQSTSQLAKVTERAASGSAEQASADRPAQTVEWQHLLVQSLPERIEQADESVDRVRLEGTFNLQLEERVLARFLVEVRRILRPGGQVLIHGLAADGAIAGPLASLPGPAALVEHVPQVIDVNRALAAAGFSSIEITKLGDAPCFRAGSVDLREMRVTAVRPGPGNDEPAGSVLYRGPLSALTDDAGKVFPRGQRVPVSGHTWESLRSGSAAGHFVFFAANSKPGCCG